MKRRNMKGIPRQAAAFATADLNPFAPLHRRLGIETYVHRQAVLHDLVAGGRGTRSLLDYSYDPVTRTFSNNHLFRASITLPRIA